MKAEKEAAERARAEAEAETAALRKKLEQEQAKNLAAQTPQVV